MRRSTKRIWLLIIVVGTILILSPVFLDLLKGSVASVFSSFPPWVGIVGLVVIGVLGAVSILWYDRLKSSLETSVATARENRQIMLDLVQNKWITGFLENPLYHSYDEQLLPLPLRERVGSRFDLVLSDLLAPTHLIPSGTTITQVFDQAGGELLILGEPGAGKTTKLLELARDLLERAKADKEDRIPVVLMLSSWSVKQLPLEQWIAEELKAKYDIPYQIGKEWVKANQLFLLLDGLDEVAPDALPACVDNINEYYHQAHRSLVVCSRTKEFLDQPGRLGLHTAVIIQPLSSEQVDSYLDSLAAMGEDIKGLKHTLHQSETLSALATTPLFLTVLILAYHGKPVQDLFALAKAAPTDQHHLLFHNYVERMLQQRGTRIHAPAQQTKHWLAWLARQMTARQQSELYLERLQPDCLPKRQSAYYQWSLGLVSGLGLGLVFAPVFGLGVGPSLGLGVGLVYELLLWLLLWLLFGLFGGLDTEIEPAEALTWSRKGLVVGLRLGLGVGLVYGLVVGLLLGLVYGLVYGLSSGLVAGLRIGLSLWLGSGLLFGLFSGFSRKQLTERSMLSPNEGIRRSTKNGLVVGLVVAPVFGLFVGLFGGLFWGPVFGLFIGLFVVVFVGLGATIQHYTLRFWLWQARCTPAPWRYVGFLDDTVEQLLLRKVGGGYIFRHRLLQDYFASLDTPPSEEAPTA